MYTRSVRQPFIGILGGIDIYIELRWDSYELLSRKTHRTSQDGRYSGSINLQILTIASYHLSEPEPSEPSTPHLTRGQG